MTRFENFVSHKATPALKVNE